MSNASDDRRKWNAAFRRDLSLAFAMHRAIETAPVPSPLSQGMTQAIVLMKRSDRDERRAGASLLAGNEPQSLLAKSFALSTRYDRYLRAAGLVDCR
jgi:hypothetical protein